MSRGAMKALSSIGDVVVLAIGLIAIKVVDLWCGGSDGENEHWDAT